MNAKTELQNYIQHYGTDGIFAIIQYLEDNGYTVELPDNGDEDREED